MLTHWKLTLAYHGQSFHGWQIQPGLPTVQGTLAAALRSLTGEEVLPQGAGRTDAGVHALAQVASFSLQARLPAANLQRALNRVLPAGIRVTAAAEVGPAFHARHSARGKHYEYRLFERRPPAPLAEEKPTERVCSPFLAPFVWDCRWPLRLDAMQEATAHLPGTRDFSAMAAGGRRDDDTQPNPVKTIYTAQWTREDDLLVFRVHGSGFLHHMVRNLVGTLVDVGRGSLLPADMERILSLRDRSLAGPTAPACGLYLAEVVYPDDAPVLLDPQLLDLPVHEVM